jgi:mRNA interferase MazF
MKKSDIVLIPFPFTDLSGIKTRPALILAVGDLDVTVSFITTQVKWQESFDVKLEPTTENGLKRTSLIRVGKLATIDKDLVIGKLGFLNKEELQQVDYNLMEIFKLKP